jgi:hypothetical protein
MKLDESKAEQILGIVFAVLGVVLLAVVIPWQIKSVSYDIVFNSPRFFPDLISALFIVLGVIMFISGRRKIGTSNQETYSLEKKEALLVLLTLATMVVYTILLYFLPYIPVTIVTLGFLIWAYGQRNWKKIIITAIVLPIIIYLLFSYGLQLRMP